MGLFDSKEAADKADKEAADKAAKEVADKEVADKEAADKEAADKAAKEVADKEAADKEAADNIPLDGIVVQTTLDYEDVTLQIQPEQKPVDTKECVEKELAEFKNSVLASNLTFKSFILSRIEEIERYLN